MQNMFLVIIMSLFFAKQKPAVYYDPVVVLELFTSQGCSSCPPAEELLRELKNTHDDKQVMVLSYHVDYWDYIGWKDPFGKKAFSDKQRTYGRKFYSRSIYTPQLVINGKEHFVGSKRAVLQDKLKSYLKKPSKNKVILSNINKDHSTIHFNYNVLGEKKNIKIRALLVINNRKTFIKRGENSNKTLNDSNIVVAEYTLDKDKKEEEIRIPEIVSENDELTLMVLVKNNDLDILGASQKNIN